MDIQVVSAGVVGTVALAGGFWATGRYGPGLAVKKMHEGFNALKDSDWARNPARPKRARALLALAELLEDEIPEPGTGQEVYDALGADVSSTVRLGSAAQWSKVLRQFGDAVDTELDDDIKQLAGAAQPALSALMPPVSTSSGTVNVSLSQVPGNDKAGS